jgi:pimeloyl-ACP methyl ester carboxylesterase
LAFDLPDIGDSKCTPPSAEKAALADILVSAAKRAGAHSPILAGIDVGGMIAFAATRDHGPRICGAIIGNTVIPGIDPWRQSFPIRESGIFRFTGCQAFRSF